MNADRTSTVASDSTRKSEQEQGPQPVAVVVATISTPGIYVDRAGEEHLGPG
jgi:hypothetical protein